MVRDKMRGVRTIVNGVVAFYLAFAGKERLRFISASIYVMIAACALHVPGAAERVRRHRLASLLRQLNANALSDRGVQA
jgi:hypothetical protein